MYNIFLQVTFSHLSDGSIRISTIIELAKEQVQIPK
jgi:hypothetical protein